MDRVIRCYSCGKIMDDFERVEVQYRYVEYGTFFNQVRTIFICKDCIKEMHRILL